MQWKNPDGSITEGVVIEDGDGNKITSFSGGGGGGGGTVTQGPAGSAAAPWYVAPGTGVASKKRLSAAHCRPSRRRRPSTSAPRRRSP